jgi:hypothetical protein
MINSPHLLYNLKIIHSRIQGVMSINRKNNNFNSPEKWLQPWGSIFVVLVLAFSGLLIITPPILKNSMAEDTPTSTEKYDTDFYNGTLENLLLVDTDINIELTLEIFESANWVEKNPIPSPEARGCQGMAPVYGTDKIVVFGGENNGGGPCTDTWVYDLSDDTWTDQKPKNSPPPKRYVTMAPIWGTDKVMIFAGINVTRTNDTWIYDLSDNNWTEKHPVNVPSTDYGHKLASIYGTDKVLLFGSYISLSPRYINETWIYDYGDNTWTNVTKNPSPSPRWFPPMTSIYGTDKVILYGGYYNDGFNHFVYNDTWIFDLSENSWVQKLDNSTPEERYAAALAPIHDSDKVLMFSGNNFASTNNETWIYDLSANNWTEIKPIMRPSTKQYHEMAPVFNTNKIVLFGDLYPTSDETWIFSSDNYMDNGTYTSPHYEIGSNVSFKSLCWNGSVKYNTSIKLQLRSANSESNLITKSFVGPDGTPGSYYISSSSDIWPGHNNESWVQYKAYLSTKNRNETPRLNGVSIIYNYWPNTTLVNPNTGSIIVVNKPIFEWNFTDRDSTNQSAFQLHIDNDSDFQNIDYDSGAQYGNSSTWQFPKGTTYTELSDGIWYWKARTKDNDGDWGLYSEPWKIIIDTKAPVSVITQPENNLTHNHLDGIFGTVFDPPPGTGVNKVEITIKGLTDDNFWDGSAWVSNETWLLTSGTSNWYYNTKSIIWTSGTKYLVKSRAIDNATNVEIPGIGIVFTIDLERPVSTIVFPIDNSYLNDLDKITGSASDPGNNGIDRIEINIKRFRDNKYWTGTTWGAGERWLLAAGTNLWVYDTTLITWTSGSLYIIQSRATDNATNIEIPGDGNQFKIDMTRPISTIEYPINNSYLNNLVLISGVASDIGGSGLLGVEICIKETKNELYWDGQAWISAETWRLILGGPEWMFDANNVSWTTDTYYSIRSRAIDNVGNVEVPRFGNTFMYDIMPPTLSMSINSGDEFTRHSNVILSLDSEDTGSGVSEMAFSNDGSTWFDWETFNNTRSFNLPAGDGEKTVYFKVSDRAGNTAEPVSDSIILDSTPPEKRKIIINENAKFTRSELVFLDITATDSLSGVNKMAFSFDGQTWTPWETFTSKKSMTLPTGDGEKFVYFRVSDLAGNIAVASDSIILDSTPPYSLSISIKKVDSEANVRTFELELKAFDNLSSVYQMSFSIDGENWDPWENFSNSKHYSIHTSWGGKYLFFKVSDQAGNIADAAPIKLPERDVDEDPENTTLFTEFWNILLIIFILILIVIIAVIVNKKRKRTEKPEPQPEEAVTVKPGTIPEAVISVGQMPPTPTVPQLPETTAAIESPQIAPSIQKVPTLASPTTPGQVPEAQQIAQVAEVPQLPPAEVNDHPEQSDKSPEQTPIDTKPKNHHQ